ncbi:response regulator transcription factor [Kribbella italica]|uniref:Two-component system alkaline phosphatase synthesis response regulator PhoP n=1 Tax=Kribbella italica TaxID=1540520 RepID=A0A7W9J677_9ACTN|nr:two-component system alkaline phosphatase synthesis response regulator PhoP [Kribbella italica]
MAELSRTVLVVDDAAAVRTVVRWQLESEGYQVLEAADGELALSQIADRRPDLVVLDLSLPKVGGLDVLRRIRQDESDGGEGLPVIVLSGRDGEYDRILGLDLGADDYLVKPFSPGELGARVRSLLRRTRSSASGTATHGPVCLDMSARTVTIHGEAVELTAKEFDLLAFFVAHPGTVFTRAQLLNRVWNSPGWLGQATVTEHVHRLRRKLETGPGRPEWIKTVRGVGYQLEAANG